MPKLITPLDAIDVEFVPILIYGPPGVGKTTLAQTAEATITLDFDQGIHRAGLRQDAMQFEDWNDVVQATADGLFKPYKTIVIDTLGRCLDAMFPAVLADSAKNGFRGNLSPQGWGVLGSWFSGWIKTIRGMRKDLVLVAHQEEDKDAAGQSFFRPDMPGKMSYKEVHKWTDMIGRLAIQNGRKVIDFNPSETSIGKNAAGWKPIEVPNLTQEKDFLAKLIAGAKRVIGQTSEASAAHVKAVALWKERLEPDLSREELNKLVGEYIHLAKPLKLDVWPMIEAKAKASGWVLDKATKTFVIPKPTGAAS